MSNIVRDISGINAKLEGMHIKPSSEFLRDRFKFVPMCAELLYGYFWSCIEAR